MISRITDESYVKNKIKKKILVARKTEL